ncbi:MAG TPA: SpoIIE family protein phosphatase [Vicinamibacterales bacterium]
MIRAVIVDDEEPARDRLRHLLKDAGVQVVGEAADGEEAVARIDALAPDLVFLDIQMPVLSGLQVAARLRAPRPRIIFCTAFDQFALEAFEHHAVDYLLKPVNRDRLARTVARIADEVREQRRMVAEQAEAARTQARLMPSAPRAFAALDCAGRCQPADGVGGDFFDFLPLDSGRFGVAVGDVSGKGMYAGILAAAIQARMQAVIAGGLDSPAAVLAEINRLTVGTIDAHRFATVFFAVIDPASGTLTYASAGHLPALQVNADGRTEWLEPTGAVIGWPGTAFEERTVMFSRGDLLVAYSDGLTETTDPSGNDLGAEAIARLVHQAGNEPAEGIVTHVLAGVAAFAGVAPAADDRTLVVIKESNG